MKPVWEIDEASIQRWREFGDANIDNDLVKRRYKSNIERNNLDLSKNKLWRAFVMCQVTTQQKSGPKSPVSNFMKLDGSALQYERCCKIGFDKSGKVKPNNLKNLKSFLANELTEAGLWRATVIADNLSAIFSVLEAGEWDVLLKHLNTLKANTNKVKEDKVANYIKSKIFPRIGLKQSRNYIQSIGLSRYEIPLDSRILKMLKKMGCTFVPRANGLNDETVYLFLQSGLQEISKALDIYPCILDACIFSSSDKADDE